jgi:hypothetical protein
MSASPDAPNALVRAALLDRDEPVRAWTPLGTIDAAAVADVDGAGMVAMRGTSWSLDWWVGAEDRWHQAAREVAVRQAQLDDSPIVETAMRVPGGDVLHRTGGVRARSSSGSGAWDDSAVLVEIRNDTSVPVALALVLRPLALDGAGRLPEVEVQGQVVRIGGRVALVLSRAVARVAAGPLGQVADQLAAGDDQDPGAPVVSVGDDGGEVALVVPLPHDATVRAVLPRVVERGRRRRFFGLGSSPTEQAPGADVDAPALDALVAGWARHTEGLARVELGEPLLDPLLVAAQRALVLSATDGFLDRASGADQVCELLARSGVVETLEPLARALVQAQRLGGAVVLDDGEDASAALLFAASSLLATGTEAWEELLVGPVAKVVHRARRGDLVPVGPALRALVSALGLVADPLRGVGQPEVAEDADAGAAALAQRAPAGAVAEDRSAELTASADTLDRALALRTALWTEPQVAPDAHRDGVAALLELARRGRPGSVQDRYDAVGTPSGARGHDPAALAARAAAVLDLVVQEHPDRLELLPVWPDEWWGRPVEVHDVVTSHGVLSFALRWHGERPALLWEIVPRSAHDDPAVPELLAPGLDPRWRGTGLRGEALLGVVERVGAPAPVDAEPEQGLPGAGSERASEPPGDVPGEGQSFL